MATAGRISPDIATVLASNHPDLQQPDFWAQDVESMAASWDRVRVGERRGAAPVDAEGIARPDPDNPARPFALTGMVRAQEPVPPQAQPRPATPPDDDRPDVERCFSLTLREFSRTVLATRLVRGKDDLTGRKAKVSADQDRALAHLTTLGKAQATALRRLGKELYDHGADDLLHAAERVLQPKDGKQGKAAIDASILQLSALRPRHFAEWTAGGTRAGSAMWCVDRETLVGILDAARPKADAANEDPRCEALSHLVVKQRRLRGLQEAAIRGGEALDPVAVTALTTQILRLARAVDDHTPRRGAKKLFRKQDFWQVLRGDFEDVLPGMKTPEMALAEREANAWGTALCLPIDPHAGHNPWATLRATEDAVIAAHQHLVEKTFHDLGGDGAVSRIQRWWQGVDHPADATGVTDTCRVARTPSKGDRPR